MWGKNPKLLTKIKENQVENCQSSSKNPILWGKNPEFLTKIKENQVENCQNSSKNPILWGKNPEFLTTPPLSRLQVKICILQVKICILQVKICILQVEICIFQVTRLSKFAPPPGSFISSAKHFFGVLLCKKVFVDLCQPLIEVMMTSLK